jgi:hypothetical protein
MSIKKEKFQTAALFYPGDTRKKAGSRISPVPA